MMNAKFYKSCAVPMCKSTTIKTPEKLFIHVPRNKRRRKWLALARRDPASLSTTSKSHFCEDHFDLQNDMENYIEYTTMGKVSQIRMKPDCLPTKFACQPKRPDLRQSANVKMLRQLLVIEIEEMRAVSPQQCEILSSGVPSTSSDAAASSIDDKRHSDNRVDAEHLKTEPLDPPSEPASPQFSWEDTSHASFHDHSDNDNLTLAQLKAACDKVNNTATGKDYVKSDGLTTVTDYRCIGCQLYITGYTCVQCDDFDLCVACEEKLVHPQHYMLRVPGPRPQREVKLIIEAVRIKLDILEAELRNDGIARVACDVEIKREVEEPYDEGTTETDQHDMEDVKLENTSAHHKIPDISNQLRTVEETQIPSALHLQNPDESGSLKPNIKKPKRRRKKLSANQRVKNMPSDPITSDTRLLPSNQDIPVHPAKRKTNDCSDEDFPDDLRSSPGLSKVTPTSEIIGDISYSQLSHSNNEISVHPAKRKMNDCSDEDFLDDLRSSPGLSKITPTSEMIGDISYTQLSHGDNEIPVHPAKRKMNDCLDEDFLEDVRVSPGLSKITATTKTKRLPNIKFTKYDKKIKLKRIKLSDCNTGKVKESTLVKNSGDITAIDEVDSQENIVKLENVSKEISEHKE